MENKNEMLPKKITFIDKIKQNFRKMFGYKEGFKFIIDAKPIIKNYSYVELMQIALIEERLKLILQSNYNEKNKENIKGINERDAEALLEWVVQNTREGLVKGEKEEKIKFLNSDSLLGYCGLGQGITAETLINMGLSPNISNINPTFGDNLGRHAFVTVKIPVNISGKTEEKLYLVDTTYRQFFTRDEWKKYGEEYIKDKKYGNKVAPIAGYWLLKMKDGKEFAEEILSKGFIEMNEKNAKLYGDSFVLEGKKRKDNTKVPSKKDLITNISGKIYIEDMNNKYLQEEIEYDEGELEGTYNINVSTPLMQKIKNKQLIKNIINKDNTKETKIEKEER